MLSWIPIGSDRARYLIGGAAILCFLFAGWRFYQAWRLALLPLQAAMAIGMGFLIEAQIFMVRGQLWHLSWWEYHLVMLMGFGLCVVALLRQYRLTGDLGAVVEGLFLRQQVDGIRHGDPQALVALTAAVAAKDTETAEHIGRVGDLVVAIGEHLGLPADRIEVLRFAGRLHDVGKIGVPNSILRKPGKLTPGEFAVIKLHSPRGGTIAVRSEMLAEAAPIIRAHHERLDGAGYPDGLKGDEIPLEARIVAVADVWDALTCDRPYRAAMTTGEAMAVLDRDAGRHLDPVCIAALYAVLGIGDARRAGGLTRPLRFLRCPLYIGVMTWYAWLLLAVFVLLALMVVAMRVLRMSSRGRRFKALGMRAKLEFGRVLLRDPRVPLTAKAMLAVVVAYLAMPFDLIPDFIPVVGQMDDAAVVFVGVLLMLVLVPRERFEAALDEAERLQELRRASGARPVDQPPASLNSGES